MTLRSTRRLLKKLWKRLINSKCRSKSMPKWGQTGLRWKRSNKKTARRRLFYFNFATMAESLDLCRLALFLWITFFFAALSSAAKAAERALVASDLFAAVTALRTTLAVFLIASRVFKFATRRLMF